jgi:hypothetical protein
MLLWASQAPHQYAGLRPVKVLNALAASPAPLSVSLFLWPLSYRWGMKCQLKSPEMGRDGVR